MKRIITIISLAALMMPVSCTKDELAGPESDNVKGNVVEFTAVMEGAASKTTLDTETGAVAWAAGDAIKLDYEIQKADSEPVVSSSLAAEDINNGTATFRVEIPDVFSMTDAEYKETLEAGVTASRHLYVVYPASVVTEYVNSGYTVTIPAVQDGKFESASISLAKWNISKPTDPLDFRNLCGLLQVKVTDENVRQIKVSSSNYIAGRANVGFASNLPFDPYIKDIYEDGASKTIAVNVDGAGTYYIAVAPGTLTDFYVELFGENETALGDRLAKSEITVERAHVLPLGTLGTGSFAAAGGFFVKPKATGTGDGSSWGNAANYAGLHAQLDNNTNGTTNAKTMVVYMAGGTYSVEQLNVTPAHNVKIYGGYPSSAAGYSLSERDVVANPTILEPNGTNKIWNLTNGTWLIDGLVIQNVSVADGAVVLKNNISFTVRNSIFRNNQSSGSGGAAIFATGLTSQNVVFENCVFSGNKASGTGSNKGLGGAIGAFGSATTLGTITFSNCLFEKNHAEVGGGVVCPRKANCRFLDCTFADNTGREYGDAIYVENSNSVSVYCDGCNFYTTSSDYVKSSAIITITNASSVVGLNNCVITGPWGISTGGHIVNDGNTCIVVNSTLFAQTGKPMVYTKADATTHILNTIVLNAASSGVGRGIDTFDEGKSYLYNSILTKADHVTLTDEDEPKEVATEVTETTNTTTFGTTLKVVSNKAETFPVEPTWYGSTDNAGTMWGNKNATTTDVTDCRGKLYYYAWDGVYPEGATFTNATLDQVKGWVNDADVNFSTWLGDRLGKDIRGESRDAQSMWPGSYQE